MELINDEIGVGHAIKKFTECTTVKKGCTTVNKKQYLPWYHGKGTLSRILGNFNKKFSHLDKFNTKKVLGIMNKEDILLGMEMGRLEIEPQSIYKKRSHENPFINPLQKINLPVVTPLPKESRCSCFSKKKLKPSGIFKKKHSQILKEPVLNILLKKCGNVIKLERENCQESTNKSMTDIEGCDPLSLCTLVDNCNQLKISSSANVQNVVVTDDEISKNRWWKNEVSSSQEYKEPKQQSSRSGSCSQQALNPPCDITIDELASYFETLVHIPKKMSSMAEMMYI